MTVALSAGRRAGTEWLAGAADGPSRLSPQCGPRGRKAEARRSSRGRPAAGGVTRTSDSANSGFGPEALKAQKLSCGRRGASCYSRRPVFQRLPCSLTDPSHDLGPSRGSAAGPTAVTVAVIVAGRPGIPGTPSRDPSPSRF